MVESGLHDWLVPLAGGVLYDLGPLPRAMLGPLEAKVDQMMYARGGCTSAQTLLSACYRRAGEVGFTLVRVQAAPEQGQDIKLRWNTVNATKVSIEPGLGEVEKEGERTIQFQHSAEYTFTAEGPGGPSVRKVAIQIKAGSGK